jgi:hypothetical protein
VFHREGRFATKFFCIPHSTENALEKYKFKKKVREELYSNCEVSKSQILKFLGSIHNRKSANF